MGLLKLIPFHSTWVWFAGVPRNDVVARLPGLYDLMNMVDICDRTVERSASRYGSRINESNLTFLYPLLSGTRLALTSVSFR